MEHLKRTVTCGELTAGMTGNEVVLNGWVHRNRDHGGIHFIDLRDRYGITQVVVDQDAPEDLSRLVIGLRYEYCIAVRGVVRRRPDSMVNSEMRTGEIEVLAREIRILSRSDVLPFMIEDRSDAKDELRLRYRYLDLRSFSMQKKIRLRHEVALETRVYLSQLGFYEIETPTMIRSTPEGARDFLVPSRLHPGKFYAMPQSPQLFKQILMVSGFDRYFQLAHCFRDEDARGDRQPEHTQIDIEMSFVSREDVFRVIEGLFSHLFRKVLGLELETPFPVMGYQDAMERYGSDKPDLRYDLEIRDFSPWAADGEFQVFKDCLASGGSVRVLRAPGCAGYSRKQISDLEETAKIYGAKGLAWMKVTPDGLEGGVSRFYESSSREIRQGLGAETGDLLLMVGDTWKTSCTALGAVRSRLGKDLNLAKAGEFRFAWVVDFPLFERDDESGGWTAAHHMFTMPREEDIPLLENDPGAVRGDLYDLVCNGFELASGSIRIHDPELQNRIFRIVGFTEEEAEKRFGFLLKAFRFGAPPHGGIAPGLDRLVMIMAGESSIREVIAFPKNTMAVSLMDDAPSDVDEQQLKELRLRLELEEGKDDVSDSDVK
jgi:aspartyl-tRNA synthetase